MTAARDDRRPADGATPEGSEWRAALNLMEDALQSRRAVEQLNDGLRESESRLQTELAATRQLQSVSALLIEGNSDDSLYQKLVDAAVAIMRSDMGSMQMFDERKHVLRLLAWRGFDSTFGSIFESVGPDAQSCCAAAWRAAQRVTVPDVEDWDLIAGTPALEVFRALGIRSVQSTPLFSRSGHLVGMISTHWRTPHVPTESDLRPLDVLARQAADLIERKWAGEATARLAAIVSSSDDAIIGKDLDGIVTSWNRGAELLFGYSASEVIGRTTSMLIPAEHTDEEPAIVERIRLGDSVEHYETVRRRKDGRLVDVAVTVSPVRDASGRIIGSAKIARDISGSKAAKQALEEADRRKNEFLAMLAHELRGPLGPIRNGLQVVGSQSAEPREIAAAAAIMERQIGHMARLIDDLIDVSRISRGKLEIRREPTEITSAVRSVAEATLPTCEAMRHELKVTLSSQPIYVNADPTRLAQVVANLLSNACKFTEAGGRIELAAEREGEDAVIRVRDSGIGIDPAQLPRIFDLFTQVDYSIERSRGGLGIGLSLVKDVVEMHGGTVTGYSAGLGQGSEFVVRLPALAKTVAPATAESSATGTSATHHRILVVDDNHDSAESLAMLLKLKGHEVRTVHDGLAAVEASADIPFEMVLLDLGLPKLNGFEAARRIRRQPHGAKVKLVALTGWGQEEYRRRSEEAGFDLHLVKPVAPEDLDRILATIGANRQPQETDSR